VALGYSVNPTLHGDDLPLCAFVKCIDRVLNQTFDVSGAVSDGGNANLSISPKVLISDFRDAYHGALPQFGHHATKQVPLLFQRTDAWKPKVN